MHICAIRFRFRASSDPIALLLHARFDPSHGCFLVPVPLSVCSLPGWLYLVPVSAGGGKQVPTCYSISNSCPPHCAAAQSPKPKMPPSRWSRSRPARFSFARRGGTHPSFARRGGGSSRRRCAAPFDTRFGDAAGELKESKTMSLSNLRQLLMGPFCSTTDAVNTVKKAYKSVEAWVLHWILTSLGGWDVNILPTHMHIDRVNLPTELSKDDSLELQLQAKSHSCYSHNDYEEKQNSWILVIISCKHITTIWSHLRCSNWEAIVILQTDVKVKCLLESRINVIHKILPKHQLFLPYLEKTKWWLFQFGYDSRKWGTLSVKVSKWACNKRIFVNAVPKRKT